MSHHKTSRLKVPSGTIVFYSKKQKSKRPDRKQKHKGRVQET